MNLKKYHAILNDIKINIYFINNIYFFKITLFLIYHNFFYIIGTFF